MLLRNKNLITAGLLLTQLFIYCAGGSSETYEVDGIYSFTLTDLNGNPMDFADLRGKAVMLNAWATWCAPCLEEMPIFVTLYEKYKDKGLEIWGVSTDIGGKKVVEPKIEELSITYPILLAKSSELTKIFGVSFRGLPVTIFFDAEGRIAYTHIGTADAYLDESRDKTVESWFEKQILNILPEK